MLAITSMVTLLGVNTVYAKRCYQHGYIRIAMLCSFGAGALTTALVAVGVG